MILALAIAALAAQPAGAALPAGIDADAAWEVLVEEPDGPISIDPASVGRDGDIARGRVKIIYANPDEYRLVYMRVMIDCPGRRHAFDAGASFSREGELIVARERQPGEAPEWEPIEAGETTDVIHRRLCGGGGAR